MSDASGPRYFCGGCGDPVSTSSHSRHICYPTELIDNLRSSLDLAEAELAALVPSYQEASPTLTKIRASIARADAALVRRQEISSNLPPRNGKLP